MANMAEYILRSARVPDSVSFSRRQRTMLSVANSNSVRSSVMLCAISCIDGWSEPSVHEKSPSAMAAVDSAAKGPITANICTSVRLRARIGLSPLRVQWSRAAVTAMRRRAHHHRARNRFWEARVARILRICNLLHKSNGEGSHGSVEVYLDLFLGSSSPYSYTFGSLTLPPDVPAHTCATKHLYGMDQYLLIPFLGGWTSIYQLFWCSPGVQGFDTLLYCWLWMVDRTLRETWLQNINPWIGPQMSQYKFHAPFRPHLLDGL